MGLNTTRERLLDKQVKAQRAVQTASEASKTANEAISTRMFGQDGAILVTGTTAVTCGVSDKVFVATQFLEDTVFDSGAGGLIAEREQLFPDDTGTGTDIDADGGAAIDSITFPKGMTLYGRYDGFKLSSGKVIAYVG